MLKIHISCLFYHTKTYTVTKPEQLLTSLQGNKRLVRRVASSKGSSSLWADVPHLHTLLSAPGLLTLSTEQLLAPLWVSLACKAKALSLDLCSHRILYPPYTPRAFSVARSRTPWQHFCCWWWHALFTWSSLCLLALCQRGVHFLQRLYSSVLRSVWLLQVCPLIPFSCPPDMVPNPSHLELMTFFLKAMATYTQRC